jgi:hypothetical protein
MELLFASGGQGLFLKKHEACPWTPQKLLLSLKIGGQAGMS